MAASRLGADVLCGRPLEEGATTTTTSEPAETTTTEPAETTTTTTTTEPAETTTTEPAATTTEPGSNLTPSQQNAVRSAQSYLEISGFSRQGLIDQLSSEFEQYPVEDATVAVDSLNVDWTAQAVKSAQSYLEISGFSCQGLIDQLSSEFGDQYTIEEATFGATQAGVC